MTGRESLRAARDDGAQIRDTLGLLKSIILSDEELSAQAEAECVAALAAVVRLEKEARGFRATLEQIANSAGRGFDEQLRNIARAALRHRA